MPNMTPSTHTSVLKKLKLYNAKTGNCIELSNVFIELKIWMDIDTPCNSGNLIIEEQSNTINNLPIQGCEYIEVEFTTNDEYESFHRLFFVYAITNAVEHHDKKRYIIHFTDVIGIINNDTRLSIRYKKKAEDIIQEIKKVIESKSETYSNQVYSDICCNKFKNLYSNGLFNFNNNSPYSVSSMYDIDFVVPYWKPLTLIDYVVSHAVSNCSVQQSLLNSTSGKINVFADCVFYQNRKGEYIMSSYDKMYNTNYSVSNKKISNNKSTLQFVKQVGNLVSQKQEKYAVEKVNIDNLFNTQVNKFGGLYGATIIMSDFSGGTFASGATSAPSYGIQQVSEINSETISSIIKTYLNIKDTKSQITFKKSTRPIFIYEATSINCASPLKTGNTHMKYSEFSLPYHKGRIMTSYIRANTITLELNGASDVDIGIPVYIDLGVSKDSNNRTLGELCGNSRWIVSKVHHIINNNLEYKTYVECFTPYWNYSIKEN